MTKPIQLNKSITLMGWISLCMFFIMLFIMGLLKIYSPDLGFHLKSAEWMLNNKRFIYTDTFTYTSTGNAYVDLQWIYQLIIYALYKWGGNAMLIISNAALITVSFLLVWIRFFKSKAISLTKNAIIFSVVAILVVQPLSFEIRPHVFSWIFLNLILLILERYKSGKKELLFLLPLITVFWANTHSLAILSLVSIAIYLAGSYFEKGFLDKKLLLYAGFSLAAFLITPYFINGLVYPFSQFISISGDNLQKSYITEMQSPFSSTEIRMLGGNYFLSPLMLLHAYAFMSLFATIDALKKKNFTNFLLLAAYFITLCLAYKNYGFFVMVSLPIVVSYLLAFQLKKSFKKKGKANELSPEIEILSNRIKIISGISIFLSLLISITSITDGYPIFRKSPHRFGFTINNDQLPVEATAFLQKNELNGKVLNHLDFGGYLMANYYNQVFIDGRMETQSKEFFKKYFESITTKNGILTLLKEYNPDVVIFPYVKANIWWEYFVTHKKSSGFKPVYFDGLSVIYVKSVKYPQLPEVAELKIVSANQADKIKELEEVLKEKNKPTGVLILINGLLSKQYFSIADQNKATYCFTYGFNTAALHYSIEGIKKSTVPTPGIYKNLSLYFTDVGNYTDAGICDDKQ